MSVTKPPSKKKRSRNGCFNCKKLKIKCDEARPRCEYCYHTGKSCIYKEEFLESQSNRNGGMLIPITNDITKGINSFKTQLSISNFELRLLKDFLRFGGYLFSLGKNDQMFNFWSYEVPILFKTTEMMRNAVFALSGMKILAQFANSSDATISVMNDDGSLIQYEDVSNSQKLSSRSDQYFMNTLRLMKNKLNDLSSISNIDISGQVLAASFVLFVYSIMHPISPIPLVSFNGKELDLVEICLNLHIAFEQRRPVVIGSIYECLVFTNELQVFLTDDENLKFPLIEHLKDYVDDNVNITDNNHIVYYAAISTIELGLFRSYKAGYLLPTYRCISNVVRDHEFVKLLRSGDYISLKIIFYLSCVCSSGNFKLTATSLNVWDNFLDFFKALSYQRFHNRFEDDFDISMYRAVERSFNFKNTIPVEYLTRLGTEDLVW